MGVRAARATIDRAAARKKPVYVPKRQPDPNQIKAFKLMHGKEFFALMMAPRTRKTKVILDDFGAMELADMANDLLIIARAAICHVWAEAIKDDFSYDLQERSRVHQWKSGTGVKLSAERAGFLKDLNGPRVLIVNVEALSRPGDARDFVTAFLAQKRKTVCAIDESTIIKNKSKRTKFINDRVRPACAYRRILSGLMTPRSPLDLFYQWEFLDWNVLGFRNWYTFRASIAHLKLEWFGGRSVITINKNEGNNGFKPEVINEMQELIKPYSFRVPFNPKVPSTFTMRKVEMTKEQTKAYNEIRDNATTELNDSHITATVVIAQIMRMHQVLCGHARDENGELVEFPENKTKALLDLLDDYSGKAIIWCSYDYNVNKITEALLEEYGEGSVARYWGGNVKTRKEEEQLFKTTKACRFMISTPDSGSMGLTWDMADMAVYFSSKDNLEHRDQSEQRTMGRDKTRGVDNVDLIVPGTVEEKILEALRKKIDMSSIINGDNYREWLV